MDKMKKVATLIATTVALSFVTAPMVATVANAKHLKCYLDECKDTKNCKGKAYKMLTEKKCTRLHGTTTEPTTTTTSTTKTTTNMTTGG
jgi:hypothetical protein